MTPFLLLLASTPARIESIPTLPQGRVRVRFDANWRFRQNPIDKVADGPGLPWTWSPASGTYPAVPTDTTGWTKATQGDVFDGRPGFAWFRTVLPKVPADPRRVLHFEAVDDNATVFVNGTRVLHHEGWNEPFDVPLKNVWRTDGENVVFVLVENQGGGGGIQAPANLLIPTAPVVAPESKTAFNDASWRAIQLPHDYVVEGTFDEHADTGHGSLPTPTAWYRKTFTLPQSYRGKSVWIDFDGVFRKSTVYLNGQKLGTHPSGYIGARYDLSKALNYGGTNVLSVFVDPRQYEGWWYEGGGIYRHVWLNAADPVHIAPDTVSVQTELLNPHGAAIAERDTQVTTTFETDETPTAGRKVEVQTTILTPEGKITNNVVRPLPSNGKFKIAVDLPLARLWYPERPRLYTLVSTLRTDGKAIDSVRTTFGIRHTRWDKDKGFFLNGKHVVIKGTCNHLDHAGAGIAVPDNVQIWRLEQLKKIGCNAVRCSHNPPSIEFLDACDRLGILVMDETRHLGDTELAKSANTTKADDLGEFKAMLLRDRNHPSIILWSLANEEGIAASPAGARIYAAMKKVAYEFDGTRPVSGAMNFGWDSAEGFGPLMDVMGFNYNIGVYDRIHKLYPNMPMMGSETASTVSTRGEYVNDPVKGYVSAYDVNFPSWAATAEAAWKPIAERPWMAGGFVWTGFDYKGEPTPYGWPCINSHFGILDMCGFPKDNAWYYKAWWGDKPVAHILPHWNHAGSEGKPISVWVHSNAEMVELRLNGRSLGIKPMPRYSHLEWSVPYEAGRLEAIGTTDGKVVARDVVETTGPPIAVRLSSEVRKLKADGESMAPVTVEIVDAQGRIVPDAAHLVKFVTTGVGSVYGVGNGDPSSHEPDRASQRHAFHGLAQVLVRTGYGNGKITLKAFAPGLKPASITLSVEP